MVDRQMYAETDPRHDTIKIKDILNEVINHVREDVTKVSEPKAEALFETTAEVLKGLIAAYTHYETKAEEAFR